MCVCVCVCAIGICTLYIGMGLCGNDCGLRRPISTYSSIRALMVTTPLPVLTTTIFYGFFIGLVRAYIVMYKGCVFYILGETPSLWSRIHCKVLQALSTLSSFHQKCVAVVWKHMVL
jgi:hypothetical protein